MDKNALAAECLVAVSGLYPSRKLRIGDVNEAIALPKKLESAIHSFMESTMPEQPSRSAAISYLRTWKRLNEKQDDRELIEILDDPEIGALYLQLLSAARAYLHDNWRPTVLKTLVGPSLLPPSTSEEERCQDLYATANDPRRLISMLSSGCVLSEELAALRALYPEICGLVGNMIGAEMQKRQTRKASYEVPYFQEIAIRLFSGEPLESTAEIINHDTKPAEPPDLKIGVDRDKGDALTKADRVDGGVPA